MRIETALRQFVPYKSSSSKKQARNTPGGEGGGGLGWCYSRYSHANFYPNNFGISLPPSAPLPHRVLFEIDAMCLSAFEWATAEVLVKQHKNLMLQISSILIFFKITFKHLKLKQVNTNLNPTYCKFFQPSI